MANLDKRYPEHDFATGMDQAKVMLNPTLSFGDAYGTFDDKPDGRKAKHDAANGSRNVSLTKHSLNFDLHVFFTTEEEETKSSWIHLRVMHHLFDESRPRVFQCISRSYICVQGYIYIYISQSQI